MNDMITMEEIKNRVSDGLEKNFGDEFMITPRIVNSFSSAIQAFVDKGQLKGRADDVDDLIGSETSRKFVENRQPLIGKADGEVLYNVFDYFKSELPGIDVYSVCRTSNHPDDKYLYAVVGRDKRDGEFMCWTSWNDKRASLSYGHYGLKSFAECFHIIADHFNDITDDVIRYGPEASLVVITDKQKKEMNDRYEELHRNEKVNDDKLVSIEDVVVNRHRRGR